MAEEGKRDRADSANLGPPRGDDLGLAPLDSLTPDLEALIASGEMTREEATAIALASPPTPAKHVLMVLTSNDKLGDTGKQTGWYLPEVAHPYDVFKKAGLKMSFASPKGGAAPVDEGSVGASKEDKSCMDFNDGEDTKALVANTVALADVTDLGQYDVS